MYPIVINDIFIAGVGDATGGDVSTLAFIAGLLIALICVYGKHILRRNNGLENIMDQDNVSVELPGVGELELQLVPEITFTTTG